MILPNNKIEKGLLQENPERIILGIDEAGRGPLAGPVVAAAAWINPEILNKKFKQRELIRDSKTLSLKQREKVFSFIEKNPDFLISFGEVDNKKIDELNILNATFLAMRLAADKLLELMLKKRILNNNAEAVVLLDGNKKIKRFKIEQKIFPRGDQNIFSISLASICAKVYRDRLMDDFHKKYPAYGFNRHRGYGTKKHFEHIKKYGSCPIHRSSFNLGLNAD